MSEPKLMDDITPGRWAYPPGLEPLGSGPLDPEPGFRGEYHVDDDLVARANSGDQAAMDKIVMDKDVGNNLHNIRVRSGKLVDPWNLRVEDIVLDDIAYALSNECRYGGHVPFYCVGQHSLIVAEYFTDPTSRLAALLHDAEEAYLKDMPSPIKSQPELKGYKEAGYRARRVIFESFGLDLEAHYSSIKVIDNLVYQRERIAFNNPAAGDITPWPPGRAYAQFKHEAERLLEQINHVA